MIQIARPSRADTVPGIHNGYVLTVPKKDEVIFVTDKVFLLNQGKLGAELQTKLQRIREFQDR